MTDVAGRLDSIRERLDDDCMGRANQHKARQKLARSDVPYLLSLVEEVGEAIAEDDIKVGATGDEAELLLALAEYTQQTE